MIILGGIYAGLNPPCAMGIIPKSNYALDTLEVGYNIGDPELVNFVATVPKQSQLQPKFAAIHWLESLGVAKAFREPLFVGIGIIYGILMSRRWWLHCVQSDSKREKAPDQTPTAA